MTATDVREVVAAVDLGGTRIKAALVDRDLHVVAQVVEPTPKDLADDRRRRAASVRLASEWRQPTDVRLVRLRSRRPRAGRRDDRDRSPVGEPRLARPADPRRGWRGRRHPDRGRSRRARRTGGRARLGAAVGARHALFLPVGTGIAAALMVDGHVRAEAAGPASWATSRRPGRAGLPLRRHRLPRGDRVGVGRGREYASRTGDLVDAKRSRSASSRATRSRSPCGSGRCRLSPEPSSRR